MTYQNQADLAADQEFIQRLTACTVEQASHFINDGRPEFVALAEAVLTDPGATIAWFVWPIATQPGFGDAFADKQGDGVTDGMLLSGTQAVWPTIANLHTTP